MCMVRKSDDQVCSHLPVRTVKHYAMSSVCVCVCVRVCVLAYIARMRLLHY